LSTLAIVSLISLLGWLVLVLASWRSHQVSKSATIKMVLIWVGIFLGVALIMGLIT
jgi:hypothetical protein